MKRLWKMSIPFLVAVSLVGCGNNQPAQPAQPAAQEQAAAQKPAEATAKETVYPLTVTDATGKEVTFPKAPERIVSTSPAETEILFALGLDDRIVGVSDYDDYPDAAKSKPKVGGVVKPNEEAILSQSPDFVIGGISMEKPVAEKLKSLGMPVYVTQPKKLDDIMGNILVMGKITNKQEQAEKLVAQMKDDIARVQDAVKNVKQGDRKKVYLEFSPGWTVGKGEFMDELISLAGATNIASDTVGWNPISEEKIVKDDPDVILYANGITDEKTGKQLEDIIKNRSGWEKIKAIRESQIYGMDQNTLSRPGPRITQGLKEVAKAIYPDLVK
ncbi:ABC transporter substrate-binding protein [Brevibacillus centrosporus]|uniref:Iron complex transport system substrate-binding protein n=1 Tax=Brevibacillus centrosporus TaxID=54910 RepID=A0A1I3SKU8_9BACL|nr:ABC transporter substrate-binding protein [Brevibacillus centrosporus]MEC2132327.1 ABC transporter substrate-binding protein [Brevibacillus centrosporus]MED4909477.1 ABC transporter substrate-binding protein [Brevibacillus centrosporus]RNB72339.1 ABC transporter substrate-binding protein [Brevibacillus centrosporus]SFJ58990.1 iron complex transport system substrate-binding protein [Brevibacillus centrosporus]GED33198.1 ABC transporter substrate-binding protein [Brevibacillus centrosporus]